MLDTGCLALSVGCFSIDVDSFSIDAERFALPSESLVYTCVDKLCCAQPLSDKLISARESTAMNALDVRRLKTLLTLTGVKTFIVFVYRRYSLLFTAVRKYPPFASN